MLKIPHKQTSIKSQQSFQHILHTKIISNKQNQQYQLIDQIDLNPNSTQHSNFNKQQHTAQKKYIQTPNNKIIDSAPNQSDNQVSDTKKKKIINKIQHHFNTIGDIGLNSQDQNSLKDDYNHSAPKLNQKNLRTKIQSSGEFQLDMKRNMNNQNEYQNINNKEKQINENKSQNVYEINQHSYNEKEEIKKNKLKNDQEYGEKTKQANILLKRLKSMNQINQIGIKNSITATEIKNSFQNLNIQPKPKKQQNQVNMNVISGNNNSVNNRRNQIKTNQFQYQNFQNHKTNSQISIKKFPKISNNSQFYKDLQDKLQTQDSLAENIKAELISLQQKRRRKQLEKLKKLEFVQKMNQKLNQISNQSVLKRGSKRSSILIPQSTNLVKTKKKPYYINDLNSDDQDNQIKPEIINKQIKQQVPQTDRNLNMIKKQEIQHKLPQINFNQISFKKNSDMKSMNIKSKQSSGVKKKQTQVEQQQSGCRIFLRRICCL